MRALSAHVKWILQVPRKSIPILRFTGKWVDYSFVLLESTRSIFYAPYSVNVTVTNELLNFSQDIMFYDFFPYSVIVTNTRRGICCIPSKCGYLAI